MLGARGATSVSVPRAWNLELQHLGEDSTMRNRPKQRLFGILTALCLVGVACQPSAPPSPSLQAGRRSGPPRPGRRQAGGAEARRGRQAHRRRPHRRHPAATAAAAPAAKPAAQKSSKDTLTIAYCCVQSTLDPHFAATTADALFMRNIHNALVKHRRTPSRSCRTWRRAGRCRRTACSTPSSCARTSRAQGVRQVHRQRRQGLVRAAVSPRPSRRSPPA